MTAAFTTSLGTTTHSRKVHLVFSFQPDHPTCDRSETITGTVGTIDGEGLEATVAAVVGLRIRPSRLCGHCFPIRTRKAVADAHQNA